MCVEALTTKWLHARWEQELVDDFVAENSDGSDLEDYEQM